MTGRCGKSHTRQIRPTRKPHHLCLGLDLIAVSCRGASMRKPAGGSKVADGRFRTWMFLTTVLVVINATLSGEDVAGIRGLILELCSKWHTFLRAVRRIRWTASFQSRGRLLL